MKKLFFLVSVFFICHFTNAQYIDLGKDTTYCKISDNPPEIGFSFQTNLAKNLKFIGFSSTPGTTFEWSVKPISVSINNTLTTSTIFNNTTLPSGMVSISDNYAKLWIRIRLKVTENNVSFYDSINIRVSNIMKFKSGFTSIIQNINFGDSLLLTENHANINGGINPVNIRFVSPIYFPSTVQFGNPIWLSATTTVPSWCKPTINKDTTVNYFAKLTDSIGCSAESMSIQIKVKRKEIIEPPTNLAFIDSEGFLKADDSNINEIWVYDLQGRILFHQITTSNSLKLPQQKKGNLLLAVIKNLNNNYIQRLKYISK